jgi:ADP-ribose pyrophosphatase YjhB (NUDIX family)
VEFAAGLASDAELGAGERGEDAVSRAVREESRVDLVMPLQEQFRRRSRLGWKRAIS